MAARLLFDVDFGRRQRKERVYRYEDPQYTDKEFQERYRFSENSIKYITELIEPELCRPTLRSHAIPAQDQVQLALLYFATGDKQRTIGDTLGYHKSTVSKSIHGVSAALCKIAPQIIKWPVTREEKEANKQGFYNFASFPGVVGAVDGTHIRIQGPSQHEYTYVNRRGYHSLNVQAICDFNGMCI